MVVNFGQDHEPGAVVIIYAFNDKKRWFPGILASCSHSGGIDRDLLMLT